MNLREATKKPLWLACMSIIDDFDAELGATFWYNLLSAEAAGFTPCYAGKKKIRICIQILLAMNILAFSTMLLKLNSCVYSVNKREVLYSVLSFLSFTW